ncbi:MAG: hypothetical protein DRP01_08950 [Archaeoglobales archaeon]|nr:MAG: hypothetical protein DRP01_08950 [Archaeoglobales archaeon]
MGYVPDVMRKNVYDVNENQKVDSAEDADTVNGINIPGPISSILTDHNKSVHDALGIAWTSLTGTPSSFSGQKGMIPRVSNDETSLEFKHNAVPSTLVVAANNAKDKLRSDYSCDGSSDQTEINNAINALPT